VKVSLYKDIRKITRWKRVRQTGYKAMYERSDERDYRTTSYSTNDTGRVKGMEVGSVLGVVQ